MASSLCAIAALFGLTLTVTAADTPAPSLSNCSSGHDVAYPAPVVADGWSYLVAGADLTRPRGIVFDTEGGLIVVDSGVGLVHYAVGDDGKGCVALSKRTTIVSDEDLNHGLEISEDGTTIYASTSDEVYSWSYNPATPSANASSRRTLVTGMHNSGHVTRTLLLSRKQPGMLLVSRGSQGNEDMDALDETTGHSQIRAFNISALGPRDDPYDYMDSERIGWGLRNSVGVAEHPVTGGIWSVENSVDQLRRGGQDIHADNPAEELNFHGYLNGSDEDQGGNYGYPSCVAVWSTEDFPNKGSLETGDQFPLDSGSDAITILSDDQCRNDYVPPALSFQAHMAPLDIKFNENGTAAYIAFHGSWNRDDPVGYFIARVAFSNGRPTQPANSTTAVSSILRNPSLSSCPNNCFRPVGLAWDGKGRLWFTSDSTGEIFVLQSNGTSDAGSGDGGSGSGGGGSGDGGSESGDDDSAAVTYLPGKSVFVVTLCAVVMVFFLA